MRRITALFFLLSAMMLSGSDLYVWQRQHSMALLKNAAEFYKDSSGKLYFLAGEMENTDRSVAVKPSPGVIFDRAVPVVRIHIQLMKRSPELLADEVIRLYEPWKKCQALQIDLDAPESKLDYYTLLMDALRKKLPKTELSATVLPCHLKHKKAFKKLADSCDYFVLQVHGLSKTQNRWFIMDEAIARNAIKEANALKKPYKAALPLYAHTVSGGLSVQPDLYLTARLAQEAPAVIGFRLNEPGEAEALDLTSALEILQGKYTPQLDIFWQQQANGAWYLMVRNKGFFPQQIACKFNLPPGTVIMDMDIFSSGKLDRMERTVTFTLPPPGTAKACMWLRCSTKEKLNQENAFSIKFNPEKPVKP